jgi:WD40 repeat protein
VGGDNTLRKFDIRNLTRSDILHDRDNNDPFVRVHWNKNNSNQIAMISLMSSKILIYDCRNTFGHLEELSYHSGRVNNIAWCPNAYFSENLLCSIGQHWKALIWNINTKKPYAEMKPKLEYKASEELVNVAWTGLPWISIAYKRRLHMLHLS